MLNAITRCGWVTALLVLSCLCAKPQAARAADPDLGLIMPRGAQRGTEVEVVFSGNRLKDAQQIIMYRPGIEVTKLEPQDNNTQVKVTFKIAPDAPLGEHIMRVRTASGVSEARTFFVGALPVVDEKEPNSDFAEPQQIPFNATVHGVVDNEDVDYYIFEAKKGQRITAEVEGIRLGRSMFDPAVAIMDMKRFELATSDDSSLLLQDPVCSAIAPEDGKYVVMVRESSYGGNGACNYRLHIGSFPRPAAIYPAGGKAGDEVTFTLIGDVLGAFSQQINLPDGAAGSTYDVFSQQETGIAPSPNVVRVSDYPNALEREPNNNRGSDATVVEGTLPVALNGVIQENDDFDWFKITAKAGQQFMVQAHARSIRSPLDPVLYINDKDGKSIASNDDAQGLDAAIRFNVPADGEYFIGIRDHLGKGGPDYVYRIEFNPVGPSVYTHIPEYEQRQQNQTRQTIVVPRGNRYATWIRVNRENFGGDMNLYAEGMPQGVTMAADTIAANVDRVPVVFEAAPDAPIGGALGNIIAKHIDEKTGIVGGFRQSIDLVFGNPNATVYYGSNVDRLVYAVAEEVPFKITVVQPKAPIVQAGTMQLKVVAERKEGFTKPITLRMLWNPPGIGSAGTVTIPEGQNEAVYPLNAAGNAEARTWKIAVLGTSDVGNGAAWVSTQLADLRVEEPFVAMKINMAATEQGKPVDLLCELEQRRPFDGPARVTLFGLPAKVAAAPNEKDITKDDKEVIFPLTTDAATPAGQHKSLFCQVVVMVEGEPVVHSVGGGGILRVDPPPPAPKKPEPKPEVVAAKPEPKPEPAKPEVKRLSRLEQLRLEAEQRRKEGQ